MASLFIMCAHPLTSYRERRQRGNGWSGYPFSFLFLVLPLEGSQGAGACPSLWVRCFFSEDAVFGRQRETKRAHHTHNLFLAGSQKAHEHSPFSIDPAFWIASWFMS